MDVWPRYDINHVLTYGQSLSSGWEGVPVLSVRPSADCLMLGNAVRPLHENAATWQPVGDAVFRPLAARAQDIGTGRVLAEEEALIGEVGGLPLGETVLEAAVTLWRRRMRNVLGDAVEGRQIAASSCGVGGRSIEQLACGAAPELFDRLRGCVGVARQAATAAGKTYGVAALLFMQGEANSWGNGTADRAEYKARLRDLYRDFRMQIAGDTQDGGRTPMFICQTGGHYATDDNAIAQAQLELTLEEPGCFLVGPVYPVPARASGHLHADGYRWLGAQFGMVLQRVLTRGRGWRALQPLDAMQDGARLRVRFHVPVPPLAWGEPFVGEVRRTIADRGFTVSDDAGIIGISAVELDGPDRVTIALERPPGPGARLLYADRRHGGRGGLHDSDPGLALDRFAGAGLPAGANADLVGERYPLRNWCVAFNIPITLVIIGAE